MENDGIFYVHLEYFILEFVTEMKFILEYVTKMKIILQTFP
jgi:hypothetical protein